MYVDLRLVFTFFDKPTDVGAKTVAQGEAKRNPGSTVKMFLEPMDMGERLF
jgi:hypothetical protein